MSSYFSFFPSLLYSNTAVTNVIAKVKFDESVSKRLATFYTYTIQEGERPDQIAHNYYQDSSYDWIIYLSNGIVDPLHEWPKDIATMNDFIASKYGSVANAQLQTAYYRVNYTADETVLTTAAYTALSTNQKKYWAPILGYNNTVNSYERKELELVSETNLIIQLGGTFSNVNVGSVIKQSSSVSGTVGFANSSTVIIKHVLGTWQTATTVYNSLTGNTLTANVSSVTTINQPIPTDELTYWAPVSYYDSEHEINERRKHITLLNNVYVDLIERDMRDLL